MVRYLVMKDFTTVGGLVLQRISVSWRPILAPGFAAKGTLQTDRFLVIDMLRGVAMLLMALDHSSYFLGTDYLAESYDRVYPVLGSLPHVVIGLITNIASGIFFTLAGVSMAFFENSRRKRGWTEWQITRFFLIRAALLAVLDILISTFVWKQPSFTFDVLSAVAFAIVILSFLRRVPLRLIAVLSAVLFFSYPLLVDRFPHDPAQPLSMLTTLLLQHHTDASPYVEFPALGRLSLVLIGYVLGRLLLERKVSLTPRVIWLAVALFAVAGGLRLIGSYGNFTPYRPDMPFIYIFVESKEPPSIVFLLFNLALAVVVLALLQKFSAVLQPSFSGHVLATLGQTSLFFYVAHLLLFRYIVSSLVPPTFFPYPGIVHGLIGWGAGMVISIPICAFYLQLKRARPESILKYI